MNFVFLHVNSLSPQEFPWKQFFLSAVMTMKYTQTELGVMDGGAPHSEPQLCHWQWYVSAGFLPLSSLLNPRRGRYWSKHLLLLWGNGLWDTETIQWINANLACQPALTGRCSSSGWRRQKSRAFHVIMVVASLFGDYSKLFFHQNVFQKDVPVSILSNQPFEMQQLTRLIHRITFLIHC